jgi:hypothetical protein
MEEVSFLFQEADGFVVFQEFQTIQNIRKVEETH